MDRVLESRLFVGPKVTFDDASTSRFGFVERIDDSQVPAMVTVRRFDGCNDYRFIRPETAFEPTSKVQRMVPPRGGITRLA